jgi:hypothetical protein
MSGAYLCNKYYEGACKLNTEQLLLPVDIVMDPSWWNKHAGITFDEDFFYHPAKRIESERKMADGLYERWGQYGLGEKDSRDLPVVGAVHLASGFLLQEMLGCEVRYSADAPPLVVGDNRDNLDTSVAQAFSSPVFKKFDAMTESLKERFGFLLGDVNWSGVLNLALDLRGESIFMDMFDKGEDVQKYFSEIADFIARFVNGIHKETGTSSISVNRVVRHFDEPIYLHSECSHTMISVEDYDKFLLPIDTLWSNRLQPYGIHFCGADPHRFADSYAKLPRLDFLDVGWGGDLKVLREKLPNIFLNIRLSPVEILEQSEDEIHNTICRLVEESGDPYLTGVCCINMDANVPDSKVSAIFSTVEQLRQKYKKGKRAILAVDNKTVANKSKINRQVI